MEKKRKKKIYKTPQIRTEIIEVSNTTSMGGGHGATCNGNSNGGRKDSSTSGCSTLLT